MKIHKNDSALVVIDPQNDVLSKTGVSWPLVAAKFSDAERHLRRLSKVASLDRLGHETGTAREFR